jgi:serine/threonine protein kinase/WD40 repeat protein
MWTERCPEPADLRRLLETALHDDDREAELSRHLDHCARCREALASLVETGIHRPAQVDEALRQVMVALRASPWASSICTVDTQAVGQAALEGPDDLVLGLLTPPDEPGRLGRLGPYQVTEVVGRGGMGVVLRAFDPSLHRFVAIKVLAPQLATSLAARIRFAREARAAAAISHEHVVAIHGVDEANGLPYLVMEYVAGISLQERLDRSGPLELEEILRIGYQTASGLAAAHAQGLVHRDVKPANILLVSGMERVKITDFGLARAADDASLTLSGAVAGTPPYMAPEQARGESVDHRADLFSLGSVLYAMCTGEPPYRGSSTLGILRRVSEEEPIPVREVNPAVPPWLAGVIATLHARAPADRFATASEVAGLLGAYMAHLQQPGHVPAPAVPRRRPRHSWRCRWPLLVAPLVCAALAGLAALHLLPTSQPATRILVHPVRLHASLAGGQPPILGVAFTPGSESLAVACDDGAIVLLDLTTRRPRAVLAGHSRRVRAVAFSPDGRLLASAGGAWNEAGGPGELKLWDAVTGQLLRNLTGHTGLVFGVAFSPDGYLLASCGWDGIVRVWDMRTGTVWARLHGHTAPVRSVAFSPDGRELASAGFDGTVRVWDVRAGRLARRIDCGRCTVNAVAYSPDGRLLATAENPTSSRMADTSGAVPRHLGQVRLRDARTGKVKRALRGARGLVLSLAFSPDGRALVSGGGSWRDYGEVILWDVPAGKARLYLHGHRDWVASVAFSPDGSTLASAGGTLGAQGEMRLWDLRAGACDAPTELHLRRAFPSVPALPVPPAAPPPAQVGAIWSPVLRP